MVGDVCGANNEPLKIGDAEVENSGKNLEKAKYMFIDITKTAAIVAQLAGDNADSTLTDLVDATGGQIFSGTARDYCMSGAAASAPLKKQDLASIALTSDMDKEMREEIRRISKKLQTEAECSRAVRLKRSLSRSAEEIVQEVATVAQMRGFLLNARLCHNRVNSTAKLVDVKEEEREARTIEGDSELRFSNQELSNLTNENSSMILVVLEPEGRLKVWRTSGLNTDQALKFSFSFFLLLTKQFEISPFFPSLAISFENCHDQRCTSCSNQLLNSSSSGNSALGPQPSQHRHQRWRSLQALC